MKRLAVLSLVLAASQVFAAPEKADTPTTELEKQSYSIGFDFGKNIQQRLTDLGLPAFVKGLEDAYNQAEPKLSQEDMQAAIQVYREKMMATQQQEMAAKGAENKKASDEFLAANTVKKGVVTLPSGLQYTILADGTGKMPVSSDTVTVHYRGTLISGEEFDSSYRRDTPASFPVTGVIAGWTEALQLMKEGAKWQLFIPPELAYGERGPGSIGPNSMLIFEVELIEIGAKG